MNAKRLRGRQLRAAIYCRVSRDKHKDEKSIDDQEAESRVHVAREGWSLVDVWADNDRQASRYAGKRGGRKAERANWQALMEQLEAGSIDVLVVWEPSRATRDLMVWASLIAICEDNQILISVNGRVYDPTDPDEQFMLNLYFCLAVRESGVTKKRVGRGQTSNVAKGKPLGQVRYGYLRVYDSGTGKLLREEVDPVPAANVVRIITAIAAHVPLNALAEELTRTQWLNPLGYKRHRVIGPPIREHCVWFPQSIRQIAMHQGYIGRRVYRGKDVGPSLTPSLFDDDDPTKPNIDLFWAAQRVLSDPRRKTTRPGRNKYLASYVIRHLECGGYMSYSPRAHTVATKGKPKYQCTRGCTSITAQDLDDFIEATVIAYLSEEKIFHELERIDDHAVVEARAELEKVRIELNELERLVENNEISVALAAASERALLGRQAVAKEQMNQLAMPRLVADLVGAHAAMKWISLTIAQKREIIKLVADIRIRKAKPGWRQLSKNSLDVERIEWRWLIGNPVD